MSIFEIASRKKIRFTTEKGTISVEQVWDLPLQARGGELDLDTLAKSINRALKDNEDESFVSDTKSPVVAELQLRLDIVKHIIGVKKAEALAAKNRAERAEKRRVILDAMAEKQQQALAAGTIEELAKKLAELDEEEAA